MGRLFPIKLDKEGFLALSRAYLNKQDTAYLFYEKVKRLDGGKNPGKKQTSVKNSSQ